MAQPKVRRETMESSGKVAAVATQKLQEASGLCKIARLATSGACQGLRNAIVLAQRASAGGTRKTPAALRQVHAVFPLGRPYALLSVTPYSPIS